MSRVASRLSARVAVERDPVRRAEILSGHRLDAAVVLAERVEVCEALLAGVPVSARRLDPTLVAELQLAGDVVLDDALALAVVARGPLAMSTPALEGRAV